MMGANGFHSVANARFWPAALGFDHSLEIFEKPQANTISMLAAEGFQIDPLSRSYYFRIVDDGSSASLTFIDVKDEKLRKTISHPTGDAMPLSGHIGFEAAGARRYCSTTCGYTNIRRRQKANHQKRRPRKL
jgi:hypothetical protein